MVFQRKEEGGGGRGEDIFRPNLKKTYKSRNYGNFFPNFQGEGGILRPLTEYMSGYIL